MVRVNSQSIRGVSLSCSWFQTCCTLRHLLPSVHKYRTCLISDSRYRKDYSKHFDPCQEAANKSIKCLHRNPNQKDLCNDYFQYATTSLPSYPVEHLTDCFRQQGIQRLQESMGMRSRRRQVARMPLTQPKIDARKKEKAKEAGWF